MASGTADPESGLSDRAANKFHRSRHCRCVPECRAARPPFPPQPPLSASACNTCSPSIPLTGDTKGTSTLLAAPSIQSCPLPTRLGDEPRRLKWDIMKTDTVKAFASFLINHRNSSFRWLCWNSQGQGSNPEQSAGLGVDFILRSRVRLNLSDGRFGRWSRQSSGSERLTGPSPRL